MKRHKWVKKGKKPLVYWECSRCGCTKQKDYGMPWFYFPQGEELPIFKSPPCSSPKHETESNQKTEGGIE